MKLCLQMLLRPQEPLHQSDLDPLTRDCVLLTLMGCLHRAQRWRRPPQYAGVVWRAELRQTGFAEALEAAEVHQAMSTPPFAQLVRDRVMNGLLDFYRHECRYGFHCVAEDWEPPAPNGIGPAVRAIEAAPARLEPDRATWRQELAAALDRLPLADRTLIRRLFWDGWSEAEVAKRDALTQSGISRRKRAALNRLRAELSRTPPRNTASLTKSLAKGVNEPS